MSHESLTPQTGGKELLYIVVDGENDGPVPGLFSLRSLGACAITAEGVELGSFYQQLEPLEGAGTDPDTMRWWASQPEAWEEVTRDARPPDRVISEFDEWLHQLGKPYLFVSNPTCFDYSFVHWYTRRFLGKNPFISANGAPTALDVPSFIAGKYNLSLEDAQRNNLPAWMTKGAPPHDHTALSDARHLAHILCTVLRDNTQI
jgi:hypothetical protein